MLFANQCYTITQTFKMLSDTLVVVFAGVIFYWGIEFTQFGWNQTSELADLPMWQIFISWPIAGFLWLLFLFESFKNNIQAYKQINASKGAA
jgi:TRAP-type C4-dicarboxylate transport system permease small subunit